MLDDYYSHTFPECSDVEKWERLTDHLKETAERAEMFASEFASEPIGRMMGATHDLGKSSREFLNYILISGKAKTGTPHKVNHSSAGAKWLWETGNGEESKSSVMTPFLAYGVAGHHAGLCDGGTKESVVPGELSYRLKAEIPAWDQKAAEEFLDPYWTELRNYWENDFPRREDKRCVRDSFNMTLWIRMLFSCLVDADYLSTEHFMSPDKSLRRKVSSYEMGVLLDVFNQYMEGKMENAVKGSELNMIRSQVSEYCRKAALEQQGVFSLTVPTGGGKTLASLRFALEHALRQGKKRIIYVIPYTSIIEQTAREFKKIFSSLGVDVVLEHHSNYAEKTGENEEVNDSWNKLASENRDAPIIVTTSVQFFESLYANKTSRCRKLHNIVNSVVIFDEVQMIPLGVLSPCLKMMKVLSSSYGVSMVLCTATQPALEKRDEFKEGLENISEIIPDYRELFVKLKRVRTSWLNNGEMAEDSDLIRFLEKKDQALCIVDTRKQARELFELLKKECDLGTCFHLSASMCPQHRTRILYLVKRLLRSGRPCRLISTQLVEAGVDIDFPVVMRCMAGIDSLTQAAGRCNREGKLPEGGEFYIFKRSKPSPVLDILTAADHAGEVFALNTDGEDMIGERNVRKFFELHFWHSSDQMDRRNVMSSFCSHVLNDPFSLRFQTVSNDFKMIDNETVSVYVPFGKKGKLLCGRLRETYDPAERRFLLRALQRYVVGIQARDWGKMMDKGMLEVVHESYYLSPEADSQFYDNETGLSMENSGMLCI